MITTTPRPPALQIEWRTSKPFAPDPMNTLQLVGTGTNTSVTQPWVYTAIDDRDTMAGSAGYSQPLAASTRALYEAIQGADLSAAVASDDMINDVLPSSARGLKAGEVRIGFSNDQQHGRSVRSIVLDAASGAGQAILGAAQHTQADLLQFTNDFDAARDGEVVHTI